MFWRRKQITFWIFWVFGLVSAGILASTAILVVLIFSHFKAGAGAIQNTGAAVSQYSGPILEQYEKKVSELIQFVSSTEQGASGIISDAEKALLEMRVPAEKKDAHLRVFLGVLGLKKQTLSNNRDVRAELKRILEDVLDAGN